MNMTPVIQLGNSQGIHQGKYRVKLPLRALQGFLDSIFTLMDVPLKSPSYSCISKRAKTVEVQYRLSVAHVVIDATGLKVFGEGEWKIRKHGKEKRRVWRKLHLVHLAIDSSMK